jgi:hypothetical protein
LNWKLKGESLSLNRNENFLNRDLVKNAEKYDAELNNRYSQVVIEWIREWSTKIKNQILAESLMLNKSLLKSDIENLDGQTLWETLIESNNTNLINEWIRSSFLEQSDENEDNLFKEKLNQPMIDMLYTSKYLPNDSKQLVLNNLAK